MTRIFFDSSALFSATFSASGAAYALLELARQNKVTLVISQDVIDETERNLRRKAPDLLPLFKARTRQGDFELIADPSKEDVWRAETYVDPKDAFIVAAALNANVDYLATFDRKHLIDPPEVSIESGITILTPGEILRMLRND